MPLPEMPEPVTVYVFDSTCCSEWPPDGLSEFMRWLADKVAKIPAAYRESASVEIRSEMEYDMDRATIRISYTRPPTDDEIAAQQAEDAQRREARRREELATLAALQAKYKGMP